MKSDQNNFNEIIKEIRNIKFASIKPLPLDSKRQEYLYNNIRQFVAEKYQDEVCPEPKR
jgi:hypothetical protein